MFDPNVTIYTVMVLSNFKQGLNDGLYKCGPLYLTVDSKTAIILNWDLNCNGQEQPDTVKLYKFGKEKNEIIQEEVKTEGLKRGSYVTNHSFPRPVEQFPGGWNKKDKRPKHGSHCLPIVIESSRRGRVIDRRCMKIYPSWMQKYGNIRLGDLFIPGTHNAGAWTGISPLLSSYVYNQDRNLYEQLVFGQRYFDLRVGISPDDDTSYITHHVIQTSKLEEEIHNIASFVKKSPREIIILDVHKFTLPVVFEKEQHYKILDIMEKQLGQHVLPLCYRGKHLRGPTLQEIWKTGRSIIISYHSPDIVSNHTNLWPGVLRDWGNKIVKEELKEYILDVTKKKPRGNPMRVLMAELTPTAKYVVTNPHRGLGLLADTINEVITQWLRDFRLGNKINIIASDFFLGNQLTEYALEVNDRKRTKN